jgi:hypothetical protein
LATGPSQPPRLLCKFKYWNYSITTSVRSVEKAQKIEHNINRIYLVSGFNVACGIWGEDIKLDKC